MGCYDTVRVPCPKCGEVYYAQSKSGECELDEYTMKDTPEDVRYNVNRHAPFRCEQCSTVFEVDVENWDVVQCEYRKRRDNIFGEMYDW